MLEYTPSIYHHQWDKVHKTNGSSYISVTFFDYLELNTHCWPHEIVALPLQGTDSPGRWALLLQAQTSTDVADTYCQQPMLLARQFYVSTTTVKIKVKRFWTSQGSMNWWMKWKLLVFFHAEKMLLYNLSPSLCLHLPVCLLSTHMSAHILYAALTTKILCYMTCGRLSLMFF